MPFQGWPYSDTQNINLDWIMRRIKGLEKFEQMLSKDGVAAILYRYLDELKNSGELDEIISTALLDQKFQQTQESYEEYADHIAEGVVSYICNMAPGTSTSMIGNPEGTTPFVAVYCDVDNVLAPALLKYDSIVDGVSSFGSWSIPGSWEPEHIDNHDVIQIGNNKYPVIYNNCSGFVSIITKGRKYGNDPWTLLFSNTEVVPPVLAAKAVEYGDTNTDPWTVDFMNQKYTWRMCENMLASGCTPFQIGSKESGQAMTINGNIERMRDGDILFAGNPNVHPDRFHGISHCMLYFRTLERLDKYASFYGVSMCPYHGMSDTEYGYIAHCSGSTDNVVRGTQNVFRIETIEHYIAHGFSDGAEIWGVNVSANGMNSSKLHLGLTGDLVLNDCVITNNLRHYGEENNRIPLHSVRALGTGPDSSPRNGIFSYGQYRYQQAYQPVQAGETFDFNDYLTPKTSGIYTINVLDVNLVNGPTVGNVVPDGGMTSPTVVYFILEVKDCTGLDGYCIQTVTTTYHEAPHKYERVVNYGQGQSSAWARIY